MIALQELFGFKCLPDEAQPKQKDCDNPLADKEGCRWRNAGKCAFDSACYFEPLNPQEPKPAEPQEDHIVEDHEMVDNILKDGFSKERRLNVAAMAMQGMLSNTTRFSSYEISDLVRISLNCADALIKEAKGGSDA